MLLTTANHLRDYPVAIRHDVVYTRAAARSAPGGETSLKLDLYEPEAPELKHRPAVVVLHGGGFTRGHKKSPEGLVEFCTELASRGYTCASIDYRLQCDDPPTPGATLLARTVAAAAEDAAAAVRWLQKNSAPLSIDPHRIALAGHSAGAATVIWLAYSDAGRPLHIRAVISMSGALHDETNRMRRGDAALCIVHGRHDALVPVAEAQSLADRAREAGVAYELLVLEDTGHGTMTSLDRMVAGKPLLDHVLHFLSVHLD